MSSLPPSDPSAFRHLGRSQRSGTTPAMLGLAALLILIAVPLYLWRHPKPAATTEVAKLETDAGNADAGTALVAAPVASAAPRLTLALPKTIRCGARGGRHTKDHCDDLVSVSDVLTRTVRENIACAPASYQPYSVSFVLSVDFDRRKSHLWAGRSGSLRRRAAADLIKCVQRAIALPDWATIPHQFASYQINPARPANAHLARSPWRSVTIVSFDKARLDE